MLLCSIETIIVSLCANKKKLLLFKHVYYRVEKSIALIIRLKTEWYLCLLDTSYQFQKLVNVCANCYFELSDHLAMLHPFSGID